MRPAGRIRILFLLQRPETWLNVRSIWARARADNRFEPELLVLPYHYLKRDSNPRRYEQWKDVLSGEGAEFTIWEEHPERHPIPEDDVVVFTVPYDMERPPTFHFDAVSRVVPATVYIPYGLTMGGGRYNRQLQYGQPTQRLARAVYSRSHHERLLYRKHCPSGDSHVYVLGHPRLDELRNLPSFAVDPELEDQVGDRIPILWNSHFSFGKRDGGIWDYSTFDRIGGGLLELGARNPEFALIWRPHPHLFGVLAEHGIVPLDDIPVLKEELATAGIILDTRPDYRHAFAISRALVTDLGSFLLEYLVTEKPILYTHNPEGPGLNEEGEDLVAHLPVAQNIDEVAAFICGIGADTDPMISQDLSFLRRRFLPLVDGRAAERILDHIAGRVCDRQTASLRLQSPGTPVLESLILELDELGRSKAAESIFKRHIGKSIRGCRHFIAHLAKGLPFVTRAISRIRHRRST